jgi:hypothetical protein
MSKPKKSEEEEEYINKSLINVTKLIFLAKTTPVKMKYS